MKVYQQISGYHQSIIDLTITVEDAGSGFAIAGGVGHTGTGGISLDNTGFVFSGYDGYLFDQSGNFFGGYQSGIPFDIQLHLKTRNLSYYHNDKLVANNISREFLNYIEFDKRGSAASVRVKGHPDEQITGEVLFFSGAGLVFSGDYLLYP